jgi:hypothetical protein
MQLHIKLKLFLFQIHKIINYWWYTECVKLHRVLRQLKSLKTLALEDIIQLLNIFPAFHETRTPTVTFTTACHSILSLLLLQGDIAQGVPSTATISNLLCVPPSEF